MCSCKGNRNSLCECHCGTRVDINPQLLEERQTWRLKCEQLQLQCKEDLKNIKDKIYKQCAIVLQKQLKAKQQAFKDVEKKRISEYKSLQQRLLPMEPRMDQLLRQNEYLRSQIRNLEGDVRDAEGRLQKQRKHNANDLKQLISRHETQLEQFEKEKQQQFDRERKQLEAQIFHLRHQIADFQAKYRQILPELERLKHTLHNKNSQVQDLRSKLGDQVSRVRNDPFAQTTNNRRTPRTPQQTTLQFEYRALVRELDQKNALIQKLKNSKDLVKTQVKTVYVDRPVQVIVQKVVQKIVEVEKIVKQYVQPKQAVVVNEINCNDDQEDYDELVVQINNRTRYIAEIQNQLAFRIRQNEELTAATDEYQKNIQKYKAERQNLAQTIANKNREIQTLESKIHIYLNQQQNAGGSQGNKIVVNVKKDGTYSSTVGKTKTSGPAPAATRKK